VDRPVESLAGIGILILGWVVYAFDKKISWEIRLFLI
jgi:hypothetical protein